MYINKQHPQVEVISRFFSASSKSSPKYEYPVTPKLSLPRTKKNSKMQFSLLTLSAILAAASPIAAQLKVNYYTDGGCSQFRTSLYPFPNGQCFDFEYSQSPSANIADCAGYKTCRCDFYVHAYCQGGVDSVTYNTGDNCASNFPYGFKSMKCWGNP